MIVHSVHNVDCMDVRQPLRDGMRKKNWTVGELLKRSRLTCNRSSLQRKLFGYKRGRKRVFQPITTEEYEALALVLGLRLEVAERGAAA
jgi:hypothetical protein